MRRRGGRGCAASGEVGVHEPTRRPRTGRSRPCARQTSGRTAARPRPGRRSRRRTPGRRAATRRGRPPRRARSHRARRSGRGTGAAERGHSSAIRAVPARGTVAQLGEQHRLAGLQPQRRAVGRRRPVDAEADLHAGGTHRRRPARCPTPGSGCCSGSAPRRCRRRRAGRSRRGSASRSAPPTCGRCTSRCARGTPSAGSRTWPARTRRPRRSRRSGCAGARRAARPVRPCAPSARSVTLNGLHGASAMRTIAPWLRSWCRATAASLAARISSSSATTSSGGRPPSFCSGSSNRAWGGSACPVRGRGDLGAEQVARAPRVQVQVVGRASCSR